MVLAHGRHSKFLLQAAAEAEGSAMEIKHGALLVRSGKVVGAGHNSDRSRLAGIPGGTVNAVSLHSEVTPQRAPPSTPSPLPPPA